MQLEVKEEFYHLVNSPDPDGHEGDKVVFLSQRTAFSFLDGLRTLVKDEGSSIPLKMRSKTEREYVDLIEECLLQGIREENRMIKNRRIKSSLRAHLAELEEDKIKVLCVIEHNRQFTDFESFLFVNDGEIIVPQKIIDRLQLRPDDEVVLEYKAR